MVSEKAWLKISGHRGVLLGVPINSKAPQVSIKINFADWKDISAVLSQTRNFFPQFPRLHNSCAEYFEFSKKSLNVMNSRKYGVKYSCSVRMFDLPLSTLPDILFTLESFDLKCLQKEIDLNMLFLGLTAGNGIRSWICSKLSSSCALYVYDLNLIVGTTCRLIFELLQKHLYVMDAKEDA